MKELFLKKSYLRESILQWIYQRVTHSMKRKGSAISGQEVFNSIHMEELMWTHSSTHAERLANPNSPFVTETENLCLSFMSHKNYEPLVQATNTCKVTNHLNFSWTSGLSSWASDLSNSLAQCLVSRNISVKHWSRAVCFSSAFWWRYISCLLSWFLLSLSVSRGHNHLQDLPSYLDQFCMLWGRICKHPWTAGQGAWLFWLLLSIVCIKLPWGYVHHSCDEHDRATSGGTDWGGSPYWGYQ